MKLSALIDENGFMTLVNFRPDNKDQTYYRIALRQPDSLRNIAQFAVKRTFPNLYKMSIEERVLSGFPPHLPFLPLFEHNDFFDYAHFNGYPAISMKNRISTIVRRIFSL
jgi:hypothetical protein